MGNSGKYLTTDGTDTSWGTVTAGANTALSNLASVAINTSLVSDTDSTDNLGSSTVFWANTYTDTLVLSAGLIGTPALTFTGDLDTGMFSPAANRLALVEGGVFFLHHTGLDNTFVGFTSGNATLTGSYNTAIGAYTGQNLTSGGTNILIGRYAGNGLTTGGSNILIGYNAAYLAQTISSVIVIAPSGGANLTSSSQSIYIGNSAGNQTTSGSDNVMIGHDAGSQNTTGNQNVLIGTSAGRTATIGIDQRTMIGYFAGYYNTAANNTFIGWKAGFQTSSATGNTFIGVNTGNPGSLATGDYNIYIGEGVVGTTTTASSIGIGYKTLLTANNQLVIGSDDANGSITDAYFGQGVTKATPAGITFNATGGSGTDNAGAPFTFAGGKGTGTGAGGDLIFQYAPAGSTGTALNALVERLRIGTAVVFNDLGNDVDFRVESDNAANLLYLDAGADTGAGAIGFFGTAVQIQQATIADADGTLADITTKFNTLLADLEGYGLLKSV